MDVEFRRAFREPPVRVSGGIQVAAAKIDRLAPPIGSLEVQARPPRHTQRRSAGIEEPARAVRHMEHIEISLVRPAPVHGACDLLDALYRPRSVQEEHGQNLVRPAAYVS